MTDRSPHESHAQANGNDRTPCATLRRIDWRFLLPDPPGGKFQHLRLFGGPPGLVELAMRAKLAARVSCGSSQPADDSQPAGEAVDAVAILGDSYVRLEQAVAGLQPNGVLYHEICRRTPHALRMTPAMISRRLEKAGLTVIGLYWAAPDFEHCRRYIPLDAPGAVHWYLSSLFVAGTPLHRLLEKLLGLAAGADSNKAQPRWLRISRRLGWIAPCICVTAVAGAPIMTARLSTPSVLARPEVRRLLATGVTDRTPRELPRGVSHIDDLKETESCAYRPLLLTSGQDDASRLVMLPFAPHTNGADKDASPSAAAPDMAPAAVIKIATHPAFNDETAREQAVLQTVRTRLAPPIRYSIPQPKGSFCYGDLAVGVEQVAPGRSLWVSSGGWGVPAAQKIGDLILSIRWLIDFHQQTQAGRLTWDDEAIAGWIDAPVAAYRQTQAVRRHAHAHNGHSDGRDVSLTPQEEHLFELLRDHAQSLVGATLPLAWQHHDFAPWNIYRAGERFTVIDWEFNRDWANTQAGPGLCDALYFVTHWHNIAHHLYTEAAELDGLHTLFVRLDAKASTIHAARKAIAHYMSAHDIDPRFLPLLLVYTWMERVIYRHGRTRKLGATAGRDKFVRYVQTLAEHAEQLFCPAHIEAWLG